MKTEYISKIVIDVDENNQIDIKINDKPLDTNNTQQMHIFLDFINQNIEISSVKKAFMKHKIS